MCWGFSLPDRAAPLARFSQFRTGMAVTAVAVSEDGSLAGSWSGAAIRTAADVRADGHETERAGPEPARAVLVLLTGADAGRTFALEHESAVLGRDEQADVQVEHSTVSRQHARVFRGEDGRYYVEDL